MNNIKTDEYWMAQCIEAAEQAGQHGNYALAAAVVKEDQLLAIRSSALISSFDPSAHPEIVVIREAAEKLQDRYLEGCVLYSTLEPCPMCTSATIWGKLKTIVYGASQEDAVNWSKVNPHPIFTWRQIEIKAQQVIDAGSPKIELRGGVMRDECLDLFDLPLAA